MCWGVGGGLRKCVGGRCREVCLGGGERCGKCVGVAGDEGRCGQVWGEMGEVCESVFGVWVMCWSRPYPKATPLPGNVLPPICYPVGGV